MSKRASCKLNSDGSICLREIIESFNSSINEEHAWALCYQCCKYFQNAWANNRENCVAISELNHIYLKNDGSIHCNTYFGTSDASSSSCFRRRLLDEYDFVKGLGMVMYKALDHGSNCGEETVISKELEQFIEDLLLSANEPASSGEYYHETDDEGIENDVESEATVTTKIDVREAVLRCEKHLVDLTKAQVETHYKAVIRAFVTEGIELATFLERVAYNPDPSQEHDSLSELQQLQFADWARYWMQVMATLRMGVKLRKVNYTRAPIEYELTPYEILMKDIRTCRYNLKKVMVDGDIPHKVTKDAHALILEFIRSRPPLKKASDRKLPPLVRTYTPREKLMMSIRKGRQLHSVKNIPKLKFDNMGKESNSSREPSTRKLIKIDFSQLQDDEDDDDDEATQTDNCSESDNQTLWPSEYLPVSYKNLDAYDLATQGVEFRNDVRRHTLDVIDQPFESRSVPQSRPGSRQSCNSSEPDSYSHEMSQSLHEHLLNGNNGKWPEGMSLEDRLSLTLEEIVHIRSVLTKADIEALPVEARVRSDVENRKVCFLCLKTRFGIFGPWGQKCIICKRTICSRCYSRLSLPIEHFAGVPVALLSPSVLATPDDDARSIETNGSTNNRITPDSESTSQSNVSSPSQGESSAMRKLKTKAQAVSRAAGVVDKLKGTQIVVCHDCKTMLQQIIKSARNNRAAIRNKTLQGLSLNLSPVF